METFALIVSLVLVVVVPASIQIQHGVVDPSRHVQEKFGAAPERVLRNVEAHLQ